MQACFDPGETRLVTVDKDGILCCWGTDNLHQLLRMTLNNPRGAPWQVWSRRCAQGRREHCRNESRDLLDIEGTELGQGFQCDLASSASQEQDESEATTLKVVDVTFISDGCDVLFSGVAGELLCVDSVSGATIWSMPAHLNRLQRTHFSLPTTTLHVVDAILVDTNGLV